MTVDWWWIAILGLACLVGGYLIGYAMGYKDRSRKWR